MRSLKHANSRIRNPSAYLGSVGFAWRPEVARTIIEMLSGRQSTVEAIRTIVVCFFLFIQSA